MLRPAATFAFYLASIAALASGSPDSPVTPDAIRSVQEQLIPLLVTQDENATDQIELLLTLLPQGVDYKSHEIIRRARLRVLSHGLHFTPIRWPKSMTITDGYTPLNGSTVNGDVTWEDGSVSPAYFFGHYDPPAYPRYFAEDAIKNEYNKFVAECQKSNEQNYGLFVQAVERINEIRDLDVDNHHLEMLRTAKEVALHNLSRLRSLIDALNSSPGESEGNRKKQAELVRALEWATKEGNTL